MDNEILQDILSRLEKLEHAVFKSEILKRGKKRDISSGNYKGATGGIRLLISDGYFDHKRLLQDIRSQLTAKGYHYSRQAVHGALGNLVKKDKILVALEEKGSKKYAKRK